MAHGLQCKGHILDSKLVDWYGIRSIMVDQYLINDLKKDLWAEKKVLRAETKDLRAETKDLRAVPYLHVWMSVLHGSGKPLCNHFILWCTVICT